MSQQMEFPETFEQFAKAYGFKDDKEVYTNGLELIPIYRVKQWLEHNNERKWIPVSERLPKERGVYIVTERLFSLDDREHKGRYNTRVGQVEYCNNKWQRASFLEVVAWMPVPEPYKEESEDEDETDR